MPGDAVAAVELEDPLRDVVEEVAIVGDRDDGARVFLEIALEPGDRLGIEVIGRLIEQQHVRRRQQQPAQRDAALLAARERADARLPRRQAQRIGGDLELALELPAAGGVDGVLQLRLLREQRVHFAHRPSARANLSLMWLNSSSWRNVAPEALHDGGCARPWLSSSSGSCGRKPMRMPLCGPRLTVEAAIDARHDPQQRGLARAVQTEHADLGAGKERQADVAQDDAASAAPPSRRGSSCRCIAPCGGLSSTPARMAMSPQTVRAVRHCVRLARLDAGARDRVPSTKERDNRHDAASVWS